MHSHILPGIDDGAKSTAKSVEYIKGLQALGYQKFIATPHILWDHYQNTPATINTALQELQVALQKAEMDVSIEAAAEYFVDEYFMDLLDRGEELMCISENKVLIEFSTFAPPANAFEVLFQMKTKGYSPVLAHPERYLYYGNQFELFQQFKKQGCALQLNTMSLIGHYGTPQKKLANQLLKFGLVDYLGTDLHHGGHLGVLSKVLKNSKLQAILASGELQNSAL